MNKSITSLGVLFFVSSVASMGQQAELRGRITEEGKNIPLISATVVVGNIGAITDLDGSYRIKVPAGEHNVTVSYIGYESKSEKINIRAGEILTMNFGLSISANILKTATVTSGKHERELGEVTISLDVIKPNLIHSTNQTSLSGLLDKVPGVSMIGDQANIRGGSGFSYGAGSRVLLLLDDMPIYQPDSGFPQWEDMPLENLEQIEVVKGAASALYGSSALNGIINVRTAYAKAEPETRISPYYRYIMDPSDETSIWWKDQARPYTTGVSFSHKRKMEKFDLVLGGYYYRNNSHNDSTMSRRGRINANLRYRFTDRFSIGVNSVFNKSKGSSFFFWKGDDALIYRPGAAISRSSSLRYNIDPFMVYFDPSGNRHKVMARFYSVENETGTAEADQTNISDFYYSEYQFQRKMENWGVVVTSGFVYNGNKVRAPLYGDTTFTARNLAGYVQLDKKFFERLNFSLGFRFEENLVLTPDTISYNLVNRGIPWKFKGVIPNGKIKESKPVARVGTSYKVAPYTFLRASWGQGYRFPTIAEKFIFTFFGGIPISPNFKLNSETGWSGEVGLRQGFKVSQFSGFLDLAAFWSEYDNMMEFTFVDLFFTGFQAQNIGDTRIKGIEASITGRGDMFGMETNVLIGYTYIDPKFKEFAPIDSLKFGSFDYRETEAYRNAVNSSICHDLSNCKNILKYRYRHAFKLDMESKLKRASLGLSLIYNSDMENIDEIFEALVVPGLRKFRKEHANGHVLLGVRGAYNFTDKLKASLIGNNLLNTEYSSRPGLQEAPRNVTLRLDYEF